METKKQNTNMSLALQLEARRLGGGPLCAAAFEDLSAPVSRLFPEVLSLRVRGLETNTATTGDTGTLEWEWVNSAFASLTATNATVSNVVASASGGSASVSFPAAGVASFVLRAYNPQSSDADPRMNSATIEINVAAPPITITIVES
jgi:hypothetical protein